MARRVIFAFLLALGVSCISLSPAEAQQDGKVWRIGAFSPAGSDPALEAAFLDALRSLGYVEGTNLIIERRYAYNNLDKLPVLAAELVDLKVDLVIATGTVAPLALKKMTTTIPIVIWSAGDPVGTGSWPVLPGPVAMLPV